MKDKIRTLQDNETLILKRPPTDRDVILGKRVYKFKLGPSVQFDKARGFKQVEGLTFFENFGKVTFHQESYIESMLEWFQMDHCTPSRTPADMNLKRQKSQNGDEEVDQRIYRGLVGSLLNPAKLT